MERFIIFTLLILGLLQSVNAQNKIGCQAWTFRDFSLEETLENMAELKIFSIEMYPKQRMSPTDSTLTSYTMSEEQIEKLRAMLKKHGIKVESYGVISLRKKEEWVKLFEFAKKMEIHTIVTEPLQDQIPIINELCEKYNIYASIHNHAKPSTYWWDPENVKKGIIGKSKYLTVCADIGHWKRSGLNIVESLKLLEGKIRELHVKDVDEPTVNATYLPLGKGIIDWENVFKELKRQKFDGFYMIEHAVKKNQVMPDMKVNVQFLQKKLK